MGPLEVIMLLVVVEVFLRMPVLSLAVALVEARDFSEPPEQTHLALEAVGFTGRVELIQALEAVAIKELHLPLRRAAAEEALRVLVMALMVVVLAAV